MKTLFQFVLLFSMLTVASNLFAQNSTKVNVNKNLVAIQGYDPVAYFEDQKPIKGLDQFSFKYDNAIYHFASKAHLEIFKKNPAKYVPEYGGFCAYGVSRGYTVGIDPEAWSIVNGKLYLNYSLKVQKTWNEDKLGYIQKADQHWPDLAEKK